MRPIPYSCEVRQKPTLTPAGDGETLSVRVPECDGVGGQRDDVVVLDCADPAAGVGGEGIAVGGTAAVVGEEECEA